MLRRISGYPSFNMARTRRASYRMPMGRLRTKTPRSTSRLRTVRKSQLTPAQQLKVLNQGSTTRRRKPVERFRGTVNPIDQEAQHSENRISRALFSNTERAELERHRNRKDLEGESRSLTTVKWRRRERSALRRSQRLPLQGNDCPPRPQLVPGASNNDLEEAFADIFNEAKLE